VTLEARCPQRAGAVRITSSEVVRGRPGALRHRSVADTQARVPPLRETTALQGGVRRNRRIGDGPPFAVSGTVALALCVYALALQFTTPHLGSVDGYFHIRYSALVREGGWRQFPPAFRWLPQTVLGPERYYDHHFLFHLWLALFAGGDLILGAKIAAALGAAAALLALYGLLLHWRVHAAHWWMIVALAMAPGFPYRLEMPRVQSLSLLCLLVALHLLVQRRWYVLAPLALVYTWLYDAFPLLLGLCACFFAAHLLLRSAWAWQPLAASAAGILAGLVLNPYFPHNLSFIGHHYLEKLWPSLNVAVGREWSPPLIAEWLGWGGLAAFAVALAVLLYRHRAALDPETLGVVLTAAMFLALVWRSTRFIEYFVPFTTLALARALGAPLRTWGRTLAPTWRRAAMCALLLAFAATSAAAAALLRSRPAATRYAGCAAWLLANTESGSLVFLSDWDDFPLLYFHNTANTYSMGLDPTYLSARNPALFRDWRRIVAGEEANPVAVIRESFGAEAALTDHSHSAFIDAMDRDPSARRAYTDDDCIIYGAALGANQ
jgi:hypothetical protein